MSSLIGKLLARGGGEKSVSPVPYAAIRNSSISAGSGGADPASYMRAYGSSGTVFSIVSMLARQTAKVKWHLYREQPQDGRRRYTTGDKGSDQRTEVIKHQAIALWNRPNPFMSRFQLMELSQTFLDLTGEAYLVMARDGRATFPTGIWPVRPDRIEPVPSREKFLAGYVYQGPNGELVPLQTDEVVQVKYPNPFDMYHGLGPIQSILVDIDAAKYSAQWNRNFFLNSATPGGVIQVDKRLSDEEWNEFTNRWREAHRGIGAAHRVAVLEQGAVWVPNAHTVADMDFVNLRQVSRDVIREAFAMHKAILGTVEDVNRANAQTAQEHFESFLIADRLDRWSDALNCGYLPLFGTAGTGVELDHDDPVSKNREADALELKAKADAALGLVTAGFDPADVLETVGLPAMGTAIEAADAPAVPPRWVPVPPAPDTPPPAPGPTEPSQAAPAAVLRPAIHAAASPNLQAVDKQWRQATDRAVEAYVRDILPGQQRALAERVRVAIEGNDLGALGQLTVPHDAAAAQLAEAARVYGLTAAVQAAHEITALGVHGAQATPVDADRARDIANVCAMLLAADLASSAAHRALQLAAPTNKAGTIRADAGGVAQAVLDFLKSLTPARVVQAVGGLMSAVQNRSRLLTFRTSPQALELVASEELDRNTCGPCADVNGTVLGLSTDPNILAETSDAYPNGGYKDCQGGARCRGTIVAQTVTVPSARAPRVGIRATDDAAARVFEQAAKDYPPGAIGWIHHAQWKGPLNVPLDHIDPTPEWLDTKIRPEHVQKTVERRRRGKKLKPVILVKTPDGDKLQLVDGHHRYLAAFELGESLPAYVGTVAEENGPWEGMHSQQRRTVPDTANAATLSKAQTHYRDATVPGRNCGTCVMFRPPHACTLVKGIISPDDVCDRWAGKPEDPAALLRRVLSNGHVPIETGRA